MVLASLSSSNQHAYKHTTFSKSTLNFVLSFFGCNKSFSNILPVHHFPDGLHIFRSHIFVLQVVRMLPHINAKEGNKPWENGQTAIRMRLPQIASNCNKRRRNTVATI